MTEHTTITVNPSRGSDRVAYIDAGRQGTGAVLRIRLRGQRGGERQENLGLTDAMRRDLIVALGGVVVEDSPEASDCPSWQAGVVVLDQEHRVVQGGAATEADVNRKYEVADRMSIAGAAYLLGLPGSPLRLTPSEYGARVTSG